MKRLCAVVPLLALLALAGCGNDTVTVQPPPEGHGRVSVLLTDGPIDLSEINNLYITFERLYVFPVRDTVSDTTAAPIEILPGPVTLDLLSLTNGLTADLGLADLPEGTYRGMWLILNEHGSWLIEADGDTHDVKVPSNKVKIFTEFTVESGVVSEIVIDMDAAASLNQTGNGRYILRPVIRQMPDRALAASIEGTVMVQTPDGLVAPNLVMVRNPRFGHEPKDNGNGGRPDPGRRGNGHGRPPVDVREFVPLSVAWPMVVRAGVVSVPAGSIQNGVRTLDDDDEGDDNEGEDDTPEDIRPGGHHPRSTVVRPNGNYKLWRLRKGATYELSLHVRPRSGIEVVSGPDPVELTGDVTGRNFVIRIVEAPAP